MPPIFSPRSNTFARLSLLFGVLLLLLVVSAAVWYTHSPAFTKVGLGIPQPVPFNHNLHVSAVGLNCRYCHTGVDQSTFADIPPAETCMSCHSQIATDRPSLAPVRESYETGKPVEWQRVNNVPDHVYFNHQSHVAKGVGCETCHGRVDQMSQVAKAHPLYMSWCLDCHRNPEEYVRPLANVYDMGYEPARSQFVLGPELVQEYQIRSSFELTNCSLCHR